MNSLRKQSIAGWIVSALVVAFMCFSASGKFLQPPEMAEILNKIGYQVDRLMPLGFLEVACCVVFLIPRSAFIGSILLTGYLGGAAATHYRVGDSVVFPIALGVVVWVAYALRNPAIIKSAVLGHTNPGI